MMQSAGPTLRESQGAGIESDMSRFPFVVRGLGDLKAGTEPR